jgi:hypothetical protein
MATLCAEGAKNPDILEKHRFAAGPPNICADLRRRRQDFSPRSRHREGAVRGGD